MQSLMPLPLAAQVFLPSIYTQRKKNQCAAKGKGIRDILNCYSPVLRAKEFRSNWSRPLVARAGMVRPD